MNRERGSSFRSSAFLKEVDNFTTLPVVLFSFFVSELREHFAKSRLVLLPAMTDSCARDVLNDQAIFTALPKVRADPLLISFSLTLGELVPNTMHSRIVSSGCLKSQF